MRYTQSSPEQAAALQKSGALMIDIRQPAEFRREHLPDAISFPLEALQAGNSLPHERLSFIASPVCVPSKTSMRCCVQQARQRW